MKLDMIRSTIITTIFLPIISIERERQFHMVNKLIRSKLPVEDPKFSINVRTSTGDFIYVVAQESRMGGCKIFNLKINPITKMGDAILYFPNISNDNYTPMKNEIEDMDFSKNESWELIRSTFYIN